MPVNLELKIKVRSFEKFRNILRKSKSHYKGILVQKDIYYKWKKGLLKLRIENSSSQLIKYNRDEKGMKRWSNYEILEVEGKNPENFFNNILQREAVVEKKRELYIYNNTRIHLDTVKRLGKFIELETIVIKNKKGAEKRFKEIITLLGIDQKKEIKSSYRNLIIGG